MEFIYEISSLNDLQYINNDNLIMVSLDNYSLNPCFIVDNLKVLELKNYNLVINAEQIMCDEKLNQFIDFIKANDSDQIKYYTVSDLGVCFKLLELGLKDKIIYRAQTYLTNYNDITNYLNEFNLVTISSEITVDEVKDIVNKVDNNRLCLDIFGKNPIFYSRRHLLSTYFDYRNEQHDLNNKYTIVEEFRENVNQIKETKDYSLILQEKYYYLFEELNDLTNVKFGFIHLLDLPSSSIKEIIEDYNKKVLNSSYKGIFINPENELLSKGSYNRNLTLLKEAN